MTGIDKISFIFKSKGWFKERRLNGVHLSFIHGWARADFNPARLVAPDGWEPLSIGQLGEALHLAWSEARTVAGPNADLMSAVVTRVDLTRDFECVTDSQATLVALAGRTPKRVRDVCVHRDGAVEFRGGRKAGSVRCYDKHAETLGRSKKAGRAPAGTLRWEAECRNRWLRRAGVNTVNDLTADRLLPLADDRWEWSRVGEPHVPLASAVAVICGTKELPAARRRGALATLVADSAGLDLGCARQTAALDRRVYRQLGLSPSSLLLGIATTGPTYRLDPETRRLLPCGEPGGGLTAPGITGSASTALRAS